MATLHLYGLVLMVDTPLSDIVRERLNQMEDKPANITIVRDQIKITGGSNLKPVY